jgi:uncharacterized RDD family membrane protein YckC
MEEQQNPFAAPVATAGRALERPEGDGGAPDANRWLRLAAALLDALIVFACCLPMAFILPFVVASGRRGGGDPESSAGVFIAVGAMGLMLIGLFVVNLVMLARYGQTPGKRIVGVRIVRADRSRAGLGRIFWLRIVIPQLIGAIPLAGPLFRLVDVLMIFGEQRRCLHDLIADTRVVEARSEAVVSRARSRAAA